MRILVISDASPDEEIVRAAALLARGEAIVSLENVATLRPVPGGIECAAIDAPGVPRCQEELNALAENAARALCASKLGRLLADRPLRWAMG